MYVVVSKSNPNKVWRQKFSGAIHSTPIVFDTKRQARKAVRQAKKKDTKIVWKG